MKNYIKNRTYKILIGLLLLSFPTGSCTKFVTLPLPNTLIPSSAIFGDAGSLTAALNGVYSTLTTSSTAGYAFTGPSLFADELTSQLGGNDDLAMNGYSSDADFGYFKYYYTAVYNINYILAGIDGTIGIPAATVAQVKGECLFLRAFCYFQLINYYGTPPLILTPDVTVASQAGNTDVATTYKQIIADLQVSGSLLTDNYAVTTRTRVNKETVNALLAKTYLYTKDYQNAIASASSVINSGLYTLTTDVNSIFYSTSNETIWQFWNQNGFTLAANGYVPGNTANLNYIVRPGLIAAFEPGDARMAAWVQPGTGSASNLYYPYKWKVKSPTPGKVEYLIQFRLAELYLIRAEAYAQTNNVSAGLTDLYKTRNRAGLLAPLTVTTPAQLITAVLAERRIELMFETGSRWFDLNRSALTVSTLLPIKPAFDAHLMLLPFPKTTAINNNPNLIQNPGY